jgi:hypothetical protein
LVEFVCWNEKRDAAPLGGGCHVCGFRDVLPAVLVIIALATSLRVWEEAEQEEEEKEEEEE